MSTLASATNLFPHLPEKSFINVLKLESICHELAFSFGKRITEAAVKSSLAVQSCKNLAIDVSRFKFQYIPTAGYQEHSC